MQEISSIMNFRQVCCVSMSTNKILRSSESIIRPKFGQLSFHGNPISNNMVGVNLSLDLSYSKLTMHAIMNHWMLVDSQWFREG